MVAFRSQGDLPPPGTWITYLRTCRLWDFAYVLDHDDEDMIVFDCHTADRQVLSRFVGREGVSLLEELALEARWGLEIARETA